MAWDLVMRKMIVEVDNKEVLTVVNGDPRFLGVSSLVPHIFELLRSDWELVLLLVPRGNNSVADHLTKLDRDSVAVTDDDIFVASIMLELPHLTFQSELRRRFGFTWGSKKTRSNSYSQSKFSAASLPTTKPSPPPPLPSRVVGSTYETVGPLEKTLISSPATPLSFSPSEPDEKSPPPPKRKPLVNNLKKDRENKKRLYDQLKSENMELKAKKQKVSPETGSGQNFHQQPLVKSWEHPIGGMMRWVASDIGGISKLNDKVGPLGLIDLNVPAEEADQSLSFGSFDLERATKARATQARLERKQICRSKKYNSACKARYA
ncbi:hypothetical protein F3Y22_tig00002840pilonHSYRG01215 [Hibiscus syriacus]|uniref:RNase H type-1 domain-containing protein n=1 Tax=Hibiscus syriacus TaxID=106335 RepID=A0A6A3CVE3_HIBSY|nr:hypothetical protein F3Y22_tig00002840pilonHSYRG01215 [Hibiscus syriacus]